VSAFGGQVCAAKAQAPVVFAHGGTMLAHTQKWSLALTPFSCQKRQFRSRWRALHWLAAWERNQKE
jgi:hypothetical protein